MFFFYDEYRTIFQYQTRFWELAAKQQELQKKLSCRRREQKEIGHDSQTAQKPFQQFMRRMSSKKTRQLKILHVCSYIGFSATSKSHSGCPWALELASIPCIYIYIYTAYTIYQYIDVDVYLAYILYIILPSCNRSRIHVCFYYAFIRILWSCRNPIFKAQSSDQFRLRFASA